MSFVHTDRLPFNWCTVYLCDWPEISDWCRGPFTPLKLPSKANDTASSVLYVLTRLIDFAANIFFIHLFAK